MEIRKMSLRKCYEYILSDCYRFVGGVKVRLYFKLPIVTGMI